METKICYECKKEKNINEFYKYYNKFQNKCKSCSRMAHKEWREKNLDRNRILNKKWRLSNSVKYKKSKKNSRERAKEKYNNSFTTIMPTGKYKRCGYIVLVFGSFEVLEHIHIMRVYLNKNYSTNDFETHHINGIRDDNGIANLELIPKYPTKQKHTIIYELHKSLKIIAQQKQEIIKLKELLKEREGNI